MIQESKAENCVGGDIQIEDRFINKCSPCYGFNYATTVNSNIKPLIKIAEMHLHGAQKETWIAPKCPLTCLLNSELTIFFLQIIFLEKVMLSSCQS